MAPLPEISRRFIDWVANYCLSAPGAVLKMAMSVSDAFKPERSLKAYAIGDPECRARSPRRGSACWMRLPTCRRCCPANSRAAAGVTCGVLGKMAELGQLRVVAQPLPKPFGPADADHARRRNSLRAQRAAADELIQAHAGVTLLDGVTGSGKTEVYFEAIAACLKRGQQALVLLPEIALTTQWLERFTERFGAAPGQWHSELTGLERRLTWRAVLRGDAKVVVGARSALFLPFRDLGLIIVDEEHEQAFKQEDGVVYQARDMAVVRGHLAQIPVILASATPSLETMQNVESGALSLPASAGPARHGAIAGSAPDRSPARAAAAAILAVAAACAKRCARRWSARSRRCCSSIAAATRRSLCAAPAGTGCNARTAAPGWWSIAISAACNAIIAASNRRRPRNAHPARRKARWRPAAPASSGWRRRRRPCSPRPRA